MNISALNLDISSTKYMPRYSIVLLVTEVNFGATNRDHGVPSIKVYGMSIKVTMTKNISNAVSE